MRINSIRVQNFRVYDGYHELALLPPSTGRNLHLVGGLNGAGKTSLFAAVTLALYGQDAAGVAFPSASPVESKKEYRRFLNESFSFAARARGDVEMAVAVEFEHGGSNYEAERRWWFDEGVLEDEDFTIHKDGAPLQLPDDDEGRLELLRAEIESIAPSRVARFFFFDGEEIKAIAQSDQDRAVIEGLNQLMGFETLERLVEDLRVARRNLRKEMPGASAAGYDALCAEIEELREEEATISRALQSAIGELEATEADLEKVEEELKVMFDGHNVESRSGLLDELAEAERRQGELRAEFQAISADLLPLLLLPSELLVSTLEKLKIEIEQRDESALTAKIKERRDKFLRQAVKQFPEIGPKEIRRGIREAWDATFVDSATAGPLFEGFSYGDLRRVQDLLLGSRLADVQRGRHVLNQLAASTRRVDRARLALSTLDSGEQGNRAIKQKADLIEQVLRLVAQKESAERTLKAIRAEINSKEAQARKLEEALALSGSLRRQISCIDRLILATEEFMRLLRAGRTDALAAEMTVMIQRLVHKEELVHRISIDPLTFEISLYDRRGDKIVNPSAGEREVFALSLVWALQRISRRNLPVIIDTPMGRLDQMHRENFVRHFLPSAGDQVIVLSTDSEIDSRWYALLAKHVAQETVIDFSSQVQMSEFKSSDYLDFAEGVTAE